MAKFGLFKTAFPHPTVEYTGDSMEIDKGVVKIFANGSAAGFPTRHLVAAIHLEKGYDVRKIAD